MRNLLLAAVVSAFMAGNARAVLIVEDLVNLSHNITAQVENYAKYIQEVTNQLTQIEQGYTQITNQVTALTRFGNPSTYVNLLGLGDFTASVSQLSSGVGQTIAQYRGLANGASALSYTGNGLYSNLTGTVDRWGNVVNYNTQNFAKFAAVNSMVDDYTKSQGTYNSQMASLQSQLQTALQNLNADQTQMGTAKYTAQINAIHAQMNALNANSQMSGQRIQTQVLANQTDAARVQEASRQQVIQERSTDLAQEAAQFGALVGGVPSSGGVLP